MRIVGFRLSIVDWVWRGSTGRSTTMHFLALALSLLPGCEGQNQIDKSTTGTPLTKSAKDGPVSLTLSVQPAELPFTDKATLIVETIADKDVTVQLTDYANAVSEKDHTFEYRLRRVAQSSAAPVDGGALRWSQRYEIEFFLPGEYELPPARLTYVAAPSGTTEVSGGGVKGAATSRDLATESIKIVARPTRDSEIAPEELSKIKVLPPVELKEPWSRWWYAAIPAGLAVVLLAIMLIRRKRIETAAKQEIIPAHEWARRQIAALVAEDLTGRGLVQEFYYRISAIVRGYIERRYSVSAPEMTTEEFLAATAGDFRFATGAASGLQEFMTACDLVKYARQTPASGEWNDLLRSAAAFVEQTRETTSEDSAAAVVQGGGRA